MLSKPSNAFLPGSVAGTGYPLFATAFAAFVVLSGCRHALGRSARFAFVLVLGVLNALGVAWRLHELASTGGGVVGASVCLPADAPFAGAVDGVFAIFSLVAMSAVFERKWWRMLPFAGIAFAVNMAGLALFAPAQTGLLFAGCAVVLLLYMFVYLRVKVGGLADFRHLVFVGLSLALGCVLVMAFLPGKAFDRKIAPYQTSTYWTAEEMQSREVLSRVALESWKASPWLGTGLGSFALDLGTHAQTEDWEIIRAANEQDGQSSAAFVTAPPQNGYWLLLSERGVVGVFFLVVPIALLLVFYGYRLFFGIRQFPHPFCWVMPLLLAVVVTEMFFDSTFAGAGPLLAVAVILPISANSFAKGSSTHG